MSWTAIDRRGLLAGIGGGLALSVLGSVTVRAGVDTVFLTAYATADAEPAYGVAALRPDGEVLFASTLPGRAHGVVPHPVRAEAVVFSRRPGRWFVPLSLRDGALSAPVAAPDDRRFTGHGAYGPGGRLLYVAEDDIGNEVGTIGVYDAERGYARVGVLPAHGIGPHEVLALDHGRILAVANGGVITHPDTGRAKLNVDAMDASLTYVDAGTGRLIDAVRLPKTEANLGIRHIAALADGGVAFGCQDERPNGEIQSLVGAHRPGGGPARLFAAPEEELLRFDGYIGSVASDGRLVAASSPRGGVIGFWDAADGRWLGASALADGCGIAPVGGGFLATSGFGTVVGVGPTGEHDGHTVSGRRWDNHLTPLAT